jgi:hypothetical protein
MIVTPTATRQIQYEHLVINILDALLICGVVAFASEYLIRRRNPQP